MVVKQMICDYKPCEMDLVRFFCETELTCDPEMESLPEREPWERHLEENPATQAVPYSLSQVELIHS